MELNAASIGIENVNLGPCRHAAGTHGACRIRPPRSMRSCAWKDIVTRYRIRLRASSATATSRRSARSIRAALSLAHAVDAGIGAWPDAAAVARHLAGRDPSARRAMKQLLQDKLRPTATRWPPTACSTKRPTASSARSRSIFARPINAGNPDAEKSERGESHDGAASDKYFLTFF